MTADCSGNSDLNVETLWKLVPESALHLFNGFASDNANDAVKEGRDTWEKYIHRLTQEGLIEQTMANGVVRKYKQLGDSFHIQQLVVKWDE